MKKILTDMGVSFPAFEQALQEATDSEDKSKWKPAKCKKCGKEMKDTRKEFLEVKP